MNRQKQKEKIKALLQQKAIDLFRTQGYEKTTVLQITESAGVAKGTFFNYFRTKEDILSSINRQHMRTIEGEFRKCMNHRSSFEQLHTFLTKLAEINEQLGKELIKSVCFFSKQEEQATIQLLVDMIVPLFEKGKTAGELRNDVPTIKLALTFIQLYVGVLHYWCSQPSSPPLIQLMNDAFLIFFTGIKKN
ncbi:TetR/AcrR family transcriptional regulator [Thermaerobacillus caldiproteolyticus]|uniref:TetR/AcrR family transcriptional regulator n=1 Tax=Thermaerobacillus caldiproteolyticus TaxID=247480 RepID=UPI0018F19070|nr:TetR/AcrR family transcriptional regulator [Anoxybacillus caldiproteolyticus]